MRTGADYGEVRWDAEITNQEWRTVASYDVLTMVSAKAIPDAAARISLRRPGTRAGAPARPGFAGAQIPPVPSAPASRD